MILQVSFSKHKSSLPSSSQGPRVTGTQRMKQINKSCHSTNCNWESLNATVLKNLKRQKINLNINAKRCGQAKMFCELDNQPLAQNLKAERAFPALSLINLYIHIVEMQKWSHLSTLPRKQPCTREHDTETPLATSLSMAFLGICTTQIM